MGNQEKKGHIGGMKQERTPGEIVAARRKQMCWSQEELEWRSGLSRTQIGRVERDQVKPTYETIEKLEEALGISLKEEFVKYRKDRSEEKRSVNPKRKEIRKMARLLVESVLSADEIEDLLMRRGQETEISNNRGV